MAGRFGEGRAELQGVFLLGEYGRGGDSVTSVERPENSAISALSQLWNLR